LELQRNKKNALNGVYKQEDRENGNPFLLHKSVKWWIQTISMVAATDVLMVYAFFFPEIEEFSMLSNASIWFFLVTMITFLVSSAAAILPIIYVCKKRFESFNL
jgi:hypothetical protein